MIKYNKFIFSGKELDVQYIETMEVTKKVGCDVYEFKNDSEKDLGIIRIQPNSKTPHQLVLRGDMTIEGYISGKGKLVVEGDDGVKEYYVDRGIKLEVIVTVGQKMQWVADEKSELIAYEICFPPYEDGRYEDL